MSKRQLVAIMFTDIEGYTALMQESEDAAIKVREDHRRIFNHYSTQYRGRVIQYYGDGTLSIFDSAVDAVHCGADMQQAFLKDAQIPVRIGIHLGDIILTEDDIIGDSVNVASRIESLGIAGNVLISDKVVEEIRNSGDIHTTFVDSVVLKNVRKRVDIHAVSNPGLIVPEAEQLRGKLEPKRHIPLLYGVLLALLGLTVGWIFWLRNDRDLLPRDILESRIAVLPFENNTTDPDLDILGEMAADWIVQALMDFDEFKVVRMETVQKHLPYLKMVAGNSLSFRSRTGAEKIITGRFYSDGTNLVVQTRILDAETEDIEFVFPEILYPAEDLTGLVEEIRERMLSYFFIESNYADRPGYRMVENPPKFEAYKSYRQARAVFGKDLQYEEARIYLKEAIELDTTFFWPYSLMFYSFWNQMQIEKADSVFQLIENRFDRLRPYEQMNYELLKTSLTLDHEAIYRAMHKIFLKDKKNPRTNFGIGLAALMANKPAKAVRHFEQLDPESITIEVPSDSWWFDAYAYGLIRTDQPEKALELIRKLDFEEMSVGVIFRKLDAYVMLDMADSIHQLIGELEARNFPAPIIHYLYLGASSKYGLEMDSVNQVYWAGLARKKISSYPESKDLYKSHLALSYHYGHQYWEALPIFEQLLNEEPDNMQWYACAAMCLINLGQAEKIPDIIARLESMETPRSYGQIKYTLAKIHALVGDFERSVQLLKQADTEGMYFLPDFFDRDYDLISLIGYPAYDAYVRPKE